MATLYVTEFARQGIDARSNVTVMADQPPVAEQTVAIGAGSVQSSAFNALTTFVRLHTDAICSVSFGTNPTAATSAMRLAANTTEYFTVPQGQSWKVAAITNT